jgi:aminotransferase
MSSLRSLLSAIGTLFSGAARNRRLAASRLDGLGQSKIRAGAAKVATDFDIIDLASGAPAFSTPEELKGKAVEAILGDHNQYSDPAGDRELRQLIAVQTGRTVNEVTITSGTSAALAGVLLALVEQGDEVIVFAPFFESYSSAIRLAGATPRYVTLNAPDWTLDEAALRAAFSKRTRAVIVNTPHNPTGRVFSKTELELVAQLCEEHEAFLIGDEIYSKLTFDCSSQPAPSLAETVFNRSRNIIVDGLSKAYNATGWRVGYVIAAPAVTELFRIVHSIMGLSAPTPLQIAARSAFAPAVTADLAKTVSACREARDLLCDALQKAGFELRVPEGATYVFADASHLGAANSDAARDLLLRRTGITSVSGSCFFDETTPVAGQWLRFCFARDLALVQKATERLRVLLAD